MEKLFETKGIRAAGKILPRETYRPFLDTDLTIDNLTAQYGNQFVDEAEKLLNEDYPLVSATMYMEFYRNGNRYGRGRL